MKEKFGDYESFDKAFTAYQDSKSTLFCVKHSKSVKSQNKKICKSKINAKKYPEKLKYARVVFICKHGDTYKSKATGVRPN